MEDRSSVKCCQAYKSLGTKLSNQGGSTEEIKHQTGKGKVPL